MGETCDRGGNASIWPAPYSRLRSDFMSGEDIRILAEGVSEPRICFGVEIDDDDEFDAAEAAQWRQAREELRRRSRPTNLLSRWLDRWRRGRQAREQSRYEKASRQLEERVKEMQCLNNVLRILGEDYASLSVLLYDLVRVLPQGLQHSDVAAARIAVAGRSAQTAGFSRTPWILKSQVVIANEVAGSVEVVYLQERPESHVGPFLIEERNLLQQVAQSIGQAAERYRFRDLQKLRSGQIERANAALERFAMTASHHLQEPLRTISSYTQMLVQKHVPADNDSALEYARYIAEAVDRMGELIDSMAVYAAVPRDTQTCYQADLNTLVVRVVQELELTIRRLDARVSIDPLPVVALRPTHAEEVLRNLIENALKFRGEARPDIRIWCEQDEEYCSLYISDNGLGIPAEYIEKVFELYARLHPRERFPGNGVGLSVCRRIVESYGGEIWAMSSPGGTVFTITLAAANVIARAGADEDCEQDPAPAAGMNHTTSRVG